MDGGLVELCRQIHASPQRAVFYVAGGGLQALTWLLTVPGASNTVLEARVPYGGGKSMREVLGREPVKFASAATAVDMARSAYRQAAHLSPFGTAILGVACTCALATDRVKRGDHKVCVATHDGQTTRALTLRLAKGARDRQSEDAVASRLLLRALGEGCGLREQVAALDLCLLPGDSGPAVAAADTGAAAGAAAAAAPTEVVQETEQRLGDPLEALAAGRVQSVEFSGGQVITDAPRRERVYLPGSFNPLHGGHRRLLAAACEALGRPGDGCFELSIGNPDKGVLPLEVVRARVRQFVEAGIPLVVTQAPLYVAKAQLFASSAFVVGHDTAVRLVMDKYYCGRSRMLLQLAQLRHCGCSLLVAGRVGEGGRFLTLADVAVPEELADAGLFQSLPESAFREDISSTQLRSEGQGLA